MRPTPAARCPREEREEAARISIFSSPGGACLGEENLVGVRCPGHSSTPVYLAGAKGPGPVGAFLGGPTWAPVSSARSRGGAVGPGGLRVFRRGDLLLTRRNGTTRRLLALPDPPTSVEPPTAVFIGDSVLLGATTALRTHLSRWRPTFEVGISQTTYTGLRVANDLRGRAGYVAVVELGTNESNAAGFQTRAKQMLERMSGADVVLWLTVRSPKSYARGINAAIRAAVAGAPNAVLVDWQRQAPPGGLTPDGIHLTPAGVRAMTRLVGHTLEDWHLAARGAGPLACAQRLIAMN